MPEARGAVLQEHKSLTFSLSVQALSSRAAVQQCRTTSRHRKKPSCGSEAYGIFGKKLHTEEDITAKTKSFSPLTAEVQ